MCFKIVSFLCQFSPRRKFLPVDHGDVVEQGTHESLMRQKGFYYKLYAAQFD